MSFAFLLAVISWELSHSCLYYQRIHVRASKTTLPTTPFCLSPVVLPISGPHYAFMAPAVEFLWSGKPSLHAQAHKVDTGFKPILNALRNC